MNLVPRILGEEVSFVVHPFNGKRDLVKQLPARLRAYRDFMQDDWLIVVMTDEDREDCRAIKRELEAIALRAGLMTKSAARPGERIHVLNRVVVEELEAWFFGDPKAILAAYPRIQGQHLMGWKRHHPDEIEGGTWETLLRVLRRAGYFRGGLPKIRVAREISRHMVPDRNSSPSFRAFRDGLRAMARKLTPASASAPAARPSA